MYMYLYYSCSPGYLGYIRNEDLILVQMIENSWPCEASLWISPLASPSFIEEGGGVARGLIIGYHIHIS